jgi:PAS domain S-box-containing protein
MDDAAKQIERRFCALVENAPDCVSLLGPDGRFIYTSPAASRINGYSQEEFQNQNAFKIIHPEDLPRIEQAFRQILQQPGASTSHEFRLQHRDGSWRWIDAIATNRLNDPALLGIVVNYRDITERKRVEEERQHAEELARSNKELEQFAYISSHDLQEPLRTVTSFAGLLRDRYAGQLDETADQYISFIVEGAERMQALIAGLLEYSRVGMKETPRRLNAGDPLSDALANLTSAIDESGAVVEVGPMPEVTADALQLTQVFQNLIGNAIKFKGKAAPRIHISATRQDNDWLFSVQDNGIGFDPRYKTKVFEVFQRLHAQDVFSGTGIGLAICKKIVERQGGKIWVESSPGQGSTFYFTIPA